MLNLRGIRESDRGTSAILIAFSMVLLLGIAAIVIDATGAGFNERRQDQIGADVSAMAGIIDFSSGEIAVRDQVLNFVADNVDGPADWQAAWEACTDPNKNDGGFDFRSVAAPAGWTVGTIDCVSVDDAGFARVRVPDQFVETTFGRVLGFDSLTTRAAAISRTVSLAQGNILPFGVVGGGESHYCLRTGTGDPDDPCNGPNTGNFGSIDSPLVGNPAPELQTSEHCLNTSQFRILATNIALGLDHPVTANDTYPAGTVPDNCGNLGINALWIDQGMGQGTEQGLINGTSGDFHSPVARPLLQQSHATRSVAGVLLNDKPMWEHLLPNGAGPDRDQDSIPDSTVQYGTNAPTVCDPTTFDDSLGDLDASEDWDNDGDLANDANESWTHMKACLDAYLDDASTAQIFAGGGERLGDGSIAGVESISANSRLAYVPQFHEGTFPPGASELRNIAVFRAVFIQGTWFGTGANERDFHPGEDPAETYGGSLRQVSGFLIPDSALPLELRGDPPPIGEPTNTFSLYK